MTIPAVELTSMRAQVTASLDQTCVIQRSTPSQSGYGTLTDSWATASTTVCTLAQPDASLAAQYADKVGALALWLVRLPYGTDVRASNATSHADRLVVGGQTLTVQALLSPRSNALAVLVIAAEVE
jgi:hypothetical protein